MSPRIGRQRAGSAVRSKRWTLLALGAALAVAALVGAVEFYLTVEEEGHLKRVGDDRYIRLREPRPGEVIEYWKAGLGKTVRFEVDADGYIAPSRVHADPDATVVFLGGSTTESMLVDADKRFPHLVGRLLEGATGAKVNSLNGGFSGNSSIHSINLLVNKVLEENVQIAVLLHNLNDLTFLLKLGGDFGGLGDRAPLVNASVDPTSNLVNIRDKDRPRLWRHLLRGLKQATIPHTWTAVRKFLGSRLADDRERRPEVPAKSPAAVAPGGGASAYDREGILNRFERNLALFVDISRSSGIVPVLMTQFNRYGSDLGLGDALRNPTPLAEDEFLSLYRAFNDRIREVASKKGVVLVDLADAVPANWRMMYDAVHLTDEGSLFAAHVIADRLLPVLRERLAGRGTAPRP